MTVCGNIPWEVLTQRVTQPTALLHIFNTAILNSQNSIGHDIAMMPQSLPCTNPLDTTINATLQLSIVLPPLHINLPALWTSINKMAYMTVVFLFNGATMTKTHQ